MKPLGTGDPLRLGPYRLHGVLGEGGMGKVYLAQDGSGTTAAVKVLLPELAHDQHLALRFLREAQTAQAVASKGVARVLGADTEGGRPWIATEFLAGPTLDEAVAAHGPLDEPGVRTLAAELATTLQDIHAAGLVHRDLKPSNIVLTSTGPRIIDFGIARPEHGLTLTTTGQAPATPGYGAPEQVLGQRVSPAADVFSLGAVLVYASGGRRAFDASHVAAVQYEVVHGEPDLTRVPPTLLPLVAPCLAKDPAARPLPGPIAAAFAPPRGARRIWTHGDLARDIKGHETRTQQYTTVVGGAGRTAAPSRRRLLGTLAVGGGVLVAGGATAAWWLADDGLPAAADAPPAKLLPSSRRYSTGEFPAPLWGPLKIAAKDSPPPLVLRDVVIFAGTDGGLVAHKVTDGQRKWALPDVPAALGYVAVSDQHVAAVTGDGDVQLFDASTSRRQWTVKAAATRVLTADDSTVYILTADDTLRAVDRESRRIRWTERAPYALSVGTSGRATAGSGYLAVSTSEGTVFFLDADTGKQTGGWTGQNEEGKPMTPLIDGDTAYLGGPTFRACSLRDGKERWILPGGWGPATLDKDWLFTVTNSAGDPSHGPKRLDKSDGREDINWAGISAGGEPPLQAPLVQGNTLWVADGGNTRGVTALSRKTGKVAWTYEPERSGPWHLAGGGNRVFLMNKGTVAALPVF
ncbi:protein kinase domain-containing protein [Streptomyces sp. NPDC005131]